jgi:hypothetical protein
MKKPLLHSPAAKATGPYTKIRLYKLFEMLHRPSIRGGLTLRFVVMTVFIFKVLSLSHVFGALLKRHNFFSAGNGGLKLKNWPPYWF